MKSAAINAFLGVLMLANAAVLRAITIVPAMRDRSVVSP
jgi:hypothetical protein